MRQRLKAVVRFGNYFLQSLDFVDRWMLAATKATKYVSHLLKVFPVFAQRVEFALHKPEHISLVSQSIL